MKVFLLCAVVIFYLGKLHASEVTATQVIPIFKSKCATCHRGPFLDFSDYPFFSDVYQTPKELMNEVALRIKGLEKNKMPPVNGDPLLPEEAKCILAWINAGLPE